MNMNFPFCLHLCLINEETALKITAQIFTFFLFLKLYLKQSFQNSENLLGKLLGALGLFESCCSP